jgi:acyl-coenzyme A thioesterase PaaI-like protein
LSDPCLVPEGVHPGCYVCSSANERGLKLAYHRVGDAVEAALDCHSALEGYSGRLHGGIIAAALDGAMTHCLFAAGRTAVTAELSLKYRQPVLVGRVATVRARVERDLAPLYLLQAELVQDGVVKVTASAKFMAVGS